MKTLIYISIISIIGLFSCKTDTKLIEQKTDSGVRLIYKPKNATSSGIQLRIIPKNPEITLSRETSVKLIDYLSKELPQLEINVQLDSLISFVDCGEGFEKVLCPNCGKEIAVEYWQECMDKAGHANFTDLTFKAYCCQTLTDLNSLKYQSDCGFAKSIISVFDPDTNRTNESVLLLDIKNMSGIDFKIVHSHY